MSGITLVPPMDDTAAAVGPMTDVTANSAETVYRFRTGHGS